MLTALSVARDSAMILPTDRVLLLTAQDALSDTDQKLSLQWTPVSDFHDSLADTQKQGMTSDEIEIRQVILHHQLLYLLPTLDLCGRPAVVMFLSVCSVQGFCVNCMKLMSSAHFIHADISSLQNVAV